MPPPNPIATANLSKTDRDILDLSGSVQYLILFSRMIGVRQSLLWHLVRVFRHRIDDTIAPCPRLLTITAGQTKSSTATVKHSEPISCWILEEKVASTSCHGAFDVHWLDLRDDKGAALVLRVLPMCRRATTSSL